MASDLTFGKVPHPEFIDHIIRKPYDGAGYTRVAPRRPIGVCVHCWDGLAWTDPAWKSITGLFEGERLYDALTDYSVQRDGTIVRMNDPRGTRSPYANGGTDGLEGDGVGFLRSRGVFGVNAELVSIEHEDDGRGLTKAQLQASAELQAWAHDQAQQPWDEYPYHAKYGCVTSLWHSEFALKPCPKNGIKGQTDEYQNLVRGLLWAGQTGNAFKGPLAPGQPVENPSNTTWPNGWTTSGLSKQFGLLTLVNQNVEVSQHGFDEKGQISNAWVARAKADGILKVGDIPTPTRWDRVKTGDGVIDLIIFDAHGEKDWVLFNPRSGDRAGYRWVA